MKKTSILLTLLMCSLWIGQESATAQISGLEPWIGNRINTEFITDRASVVAVAFPQKVAKDPKFDIFPREIVTAWGLKELGFDPMLITQGTFVIEEVDDLGRLPKWAAALQFEEMQGLAGNLLKELEKKRIGDRVLYEAPSGLPGYVSFLIYDESTILVGDKELFESMVRAQESGVLRDLVEKASVKGEVMGFADFRPLRPVLKQALQGIPAMLPPPVTKLKLLPDLIDAIEVGITVEGRIKTMIKFHGVEEADTKKAAKIIRDAIAFGSDMGIGAMAAQMDFNDPVQSATVDYVQRFAEYMQDQMDPEVEGAAFAMNLDQEATTLPILVGMLLPAVQQTRAAARRTSSMNNSRQMLLAMLNFESANGSFPAQASYDANGKPLLSWRVHILPFIEQQALYEEFHLDEPWDSPHNRKLISRMPMAYQSPSVASMGDGKTVYLGLSGDGMAFGKDARNLRDFTDGTSNSIVMVEVDPSASVIWTKPEDFTPNSRDPRRGLGSVNPGGFIATFADGSVRFISNSIDPEVLKGMMTISGGEAINR
ncbi:MAG: DUF1559 domain-containing protein [Planctomycetota bacterium]